MENHRGRDDKLRNRRFAAWLRDARRDAKLTQEELAEKMDVTQSAIHLWEKDGLETMTPATIRRLAAALGVTPVAVADAMGYPVASERVNSLSLPRPDDDTPPGIARRMAELDHRLAQLEARERGPAPRDTDEDIAS